MQYHFVHTVTDSLYFDFICDNQSFCVEESFAEYSLLFVECCEVLTSLSSLTIPLIRPDIFLHNETKCLELFMDQKEQLVIHAFSFFPLQMVNQ